MPLTISELLAAELPIDNPEVAGLNGPFGLHGGLSAALLLRRMREHAPADRSLVALTARFLRPLGTRIAIGAEPVLNGSLVTVVDASASTDGKLGMQASAVFSAEQNPQTPVLAPEMPDGLPHWSSTEVLFISPEFSPVAAHQEIRPALPNLPYSGADAPVLCAWIRLKGADAATPEERLVTLADSVGPSFTAMLRQPKANPTIEMSVQVSAAAQRTDVDRVLVRAETTSADARGWVSESIEVWNDDGVHLATARQVRVVR